MTCAKDGCTKAAHAKGLCKNHYERQRERAMRLLNPAVRRCTDCASEFNPRGPQQRCTTCRTKVCPSCGGSFLTDKRKRSHCSRRCVGSDPTNVLYWLNKRSAARRLDQGVLDFGDVG